MNSKQNGFTLIELVMVIVILGFLSAFALPRFADLSGDSRAAVREGVIGAIKSASSITYSKCIVDSSCDQEASSSSIVLEGESIEVAYGYPAGNDNGIKKAAQLDDFSTSGGGPQRPTRPTPYTILIDDKTDCSITYAPASASSSPVLGGDDTCS